MAQKNHTLLVVGLLGIGGIVAYEWWKNRTIAPVAVLDTSGTPTTAVMPVNTTTTTVQSGSGQLSTIAPATTQAIDPAVVASVQAWANQDGRAPVLAMAAAMVPSEYQGMYTLINDYWNKGIAPSQQYVDFWNNLRSKYDPTHTSW